VIDENQRLKNTHQGELMKVASKSMKAAFALGAMIGVLPTANAGTITSFVGSVVVGGVVELVLPSRSLNENASEGTYIYDGAAIDAFCIEVSQKTSFPSLYTPSLLGQNTARYSLLNSLYSQYYSANKYSSVGAAALQATIWEIYEDPNNLNFSAGNFILGGATDTAVAALSAQMLQSIKTSVSPATWDFTQYASPTSQDLITARRIGSVPVPASALLLSIGVVALLGSRKSNLNT
jgi:hypothetical protein